MCRFKLSISDKQRVIACSYDYIDQFNRLLDTRYDHIPVIFDLKGKCSGMFVVRNNEMWIRYNETIFSRYFDDAIVNTTAHEVAHYIAYRLYAGRRIKPHGVEWQELMSLVGVKAETTSRYNLDGLPIRRQNTHTYVCACREHQLTTTRHNKIRLKKASYSCKFCRQPLRQDNARIL